MKSAVLLLCFVALTSVVYCADLPIGPSHTGAVTWYNANGGGACSFSPNDFVQSQLLVAAASDFQSAKACGSCVKIWSTKTGRSATVKIVDLCPGCGSTYDFDLSNYAFSLLDSPANGFNSACWNYVACPTTGNLQYRIKEGSNPWWFVVMAYNNKLPIQKFEIKEKNSQTWLSLSLLDYNYYDASVLGHQVKLPVSVRVTGINGEVITDTDVITSIPAAGGKFDGQSQFSDSGFSGSITCAGGATTSVGTTTTSGGGTTGGGSTTGGSSGTAKACKKLKKQSQCAARTDCAWTIVKGKKKCSTA